MLYPEILALLDGARFSNLPFLCTVLSLKLDNHLITITSANALEFIRLEKRLNEKIELADNILHPFLPREYSFPFFCYGGPIIERRHHI